MTQEQLKTITTIRHCIGRLNTCINLWGFVMPFCGLGSKTDLENEFEQFLEDAVGDTDKNQNTDIYHYASYFADLIRKMAYDLSMVYITDVFTALQQNTDGTKKVWEKMPCSIKKTESKVRHIRNSHIAHSMEHQTSGKHSPRGADVYNDNGGVVLSVRWDTNDCEFKKERPTIQELLNICRDTKNILYEEKQKILQEPQSNDKT